MPNSSWKLQNGASRKTRASPARATLSEKTQWFPARAFSQNEAHATSMQPLQCVLQHQVANPHLSTHMAPQNDNNHAAFTMRSATRDSRNAWNYAHMNNHLLQNTEEEPIRARIERSRTRRTQEVPFIAGQSHFTRKNTMVSCPGFLPKRSPCKIHAAITMRFATSGCKPASLDAHGNTKRHQSCSRYTAICNTLQPEIQETNGTTHTWTTTCCRTQRRNMEEPIRARFKRSRTRRTQEVPLIAGQSRFIRKKHKVSCPGFLPKRSPCKIHAAITMRFATSGCKPASLDAHGNTKRHQSCSRYTAICNTLQPEIQETNGTTHTWTTTCCRTQRRNMEEPIRARFERSRTRRTQKVPFIAGQSHFIRKEHKVSCPGFLPKRSPCNIHAAITMRLASMSIVSHFLMLCDAKSHTTHCSVMWSHTPPFIECSLTLLIVMLCKLTHHPSLHILAHFSLLCNVNSHTTLHCIYSHTSHCCVM